jgi:hypothetical protein
MNIYATENGYELLALSFDGTTPKFSQNAKKVKLQPRLLIDYQEHTLNSRSSTCWLWAQSIPDLSIGRIA